MQVVRFADCPQVPWRNGAGTTRELWALRSATVTPLVRISIAEITGAQEFSTFPEIDRMILQLDGPPMELIIDGAPHPMTPLVPLGFPGEAQVTCTLDTARPAHDLNLMCKRGHFTPRMQLMETTPGTSSDIGAPHAITALLALGSTALSQPLETSLNAHDLILARGPFSVRTAQHSTFVRLTALATGTGG